MYYFVVRIILCYSVTDLFWHRYEDNINKEMG